MINKLFLDLEDTIITPVLDGWHNTELINVEKIRRFIEENDIESVNIFSFAVWNEREKNLFKKHCLPMIESALGVTVFRIPAVDEEIIPGCCVQKGIAPSLVEFSEMSAFWSKDLAFVLCMKEWFKTSQNIHCILLDDAVDDMSIEFKKNNLKLTLLNIDQMD